MGDSDRTCRSAPDGDVTGPAAEEGPTCGRLCRRQPRHVQIPDHTVRPHGPYICTIKSPASTPTIGPSRPTSSQIPIRSPTPHPLLDPVRHSPLKQFSARQAASAVRAPTRGLYREHSTPLWRGTAPDSRAERGWRGKGFLWMERVSRVEGKTTSREWDAGTETGGYMVSLPIWTG